MSRGLQHVPIVALLAASTLPLQARTDWPQWRGPLRTGVIAAADAPASWPAHLSKGWSTPVGEGYSSPVTGDGRVYVHARRDPDEVITALDLAGGTVVWEQKYAAPFEKNPYAKQMAKGPYSTPLFAGGRLYTLGTTGILSAWNAATGQLLWRQDHSQKIDSSKLFCGTAMSPVATERGIVVQIGDDRGASLIAYDAASGTEVWTRPLAGAGYASPIELRLHGAPQLVTMTTRSVVGVAVDSGTVLWEFPFKDEWNENIVTPVPTSSGVIVSGVRQGTRALVLGRTGATWTATEAWHTPDVTMYMSSPVVVENVMFGHSSKRKGQFVAVDPGTGKILWATEGRGGGNASVLVAGRNLVFLTSESELIVAEANATAYKEVRRYSVASSPTYAHPIVLKDRVIVRDATHVTVWTVN